MQDENAHKQTAPIRFLSLFSGIEAASVAWHPLDWECAAVAEIEPFPCALLAHHYPGVPNLGDVTRITEYQIKQLGHIDLVVGGFPCQDLSVAGKRKGLTNADGTATRSGLFFTGMQIFHWARQHCGTRFLLIENVPGLYSSNKGADFAAVVGHMAGLENVSVPANGWGAEGVAVGNNGLLEWCVLDAQWFGVAQRRRRVFALLDTGDWINRPPVLLESESLRGDSPPSREKGERPAPTISARTKGGGGLGTDFDCDGGLVGCWWDGGQVSQTLDAVLSKGQAMPEKNRFPAVLQPVTHSLRADGFDARRSCSITDCGKNRHAGGLCSSHYNRLKRHGNPLGGRVNEGEPLAFLLSHIGHNDDDCLLWPYATLATGYGSVEYGGKTVRAHRLMCEKAHGEPPSPELDAAHSCRVRLCINPRHLRWATRADNMADAIAHGTTTRGERHGGHKLTEPEVRAILKSLSQGETHEGIAGNYGVSRNAITDIAKGKNWAWLSTESEDGTGRGTPLVPLAASTLKANNGGGGFGSDPSETFIPIAFSCKDHAADAADTSPTLRAMGHDESHANAGGQIAVAFDWQSGGDSRGLDPKETAQLQRCQVPAVAFDLRGREGGAMPEGPHDTVNMRSASGGSSKSYIAETMAVRRITPTEAERLQGFPDSYTLVPYRGKYAADGPRYKALGNSFAVPVVRWIGERIQMVEDLQLQMSA